MTDPSPSQTEPTEPAEGKQDAPPAEGRRAHGAQPPRWSEHQPEPAPWYVGRPGAAGQQGGGWGGPAPQQPGAAGPYPGYGPQGAPGQAPTGAPGQEPADRRPGETGSRGSAGPGAAAPAQAPSDAAPGDPAPGTQSSAVRPGDQGAAPRDSSRPGQSQPTQSQPTQGQSGQGQPTQGQPTQGQSGQGQSGQGRPAQGQNGEVPAWTGKLPERGAPADGQGSGRVPGQGPQGPTDPGGPQNPYGQGPYGPYGRPGQGQGPQQGGQAPWHDPNRYGPPSRRPDGSRPGQERPGAPAEPRGPLDLRTRWARGLALGATACMLIALWYAYSSIADFPTFLISAAVGLAMGMVGLWLGVFAQRAAMKKNKRSPEAVSSIVWSSIAAFISLMIIAYSLIFYSPLSRFANCMRSATTIALQNKCLSNYENSYGGEG